MRFYAGMERDAAFKKFDNVIDGLIDEADAVDAAGAKVTVRGHA